MPLYIRDDDVARLAREVQAACGARTVTEAVRGALERDLGRLRDSLPPSRRLDKAVALADAMGPAEAPIP